ncbi:MAG: DoxX family protein [Flavobacteriia bacterium]|jgi:uncharacterized membrane protein YphA (DoxX/SURF4 family)
MMKNSQTIQGQSLVFNALLILINLAGLTFVTIGFHDNFVESKWLYAGIGFALMAISIAGLVILKGRLFMSMVSRLLVGGLFIVSGLIKANDPLGFSYKLEEYFEDGALAFRIKEWFGAPGFSLEFLIDWALILSVVICVAEIVLGVLVLIGGKIKLVSWMLVLMMLFFTFLTWHTANCDSKIKFVDRDTYEMSNPLAQIKIDEAKGNTEIKIISKNTKEVVVEEMKAPQCVSDCGCFGDAMKGSVGRSLTPKESLWKDIVLVYLVLWIFLAQRKIQPNRREENFYVVPIAMIIISFFSFIFGWYFPVVFGLLSILGALWILRSGGRIFGNYFGSTVLVSLLGFALTTYVLMFEPVKDYRAYAVGSNLKQKMNDGIDGNYQDLLVYKNLKTGEKKEFDSKGQEYINSKIWEKADIWKYDTMYQKVILETKLPSITGQFNPVVQLAEVGKDELKLDFIQQKLKTALIDGVLLYDKDNETDVEVAANEYNTNDYDTAFFTFKKEIKMNNPELNEISIRDYIVDSKQIIILFSKKLSDVKDPKKISELKQIFAQATKNKIPMVLVCSSSREEINTWKKKHNFHIPAFINDETELKAIARSNPSLMIVQNAVVKGKYPSRSLPSYEWLKKHILK